MFTMYSENVFRSRTSGKGFLQLCCTISNYQLRVQLTLWL